MLDPGFDESRFFTVVADLTCARVRGAEADEVRAFWTTFGPLPERLVRTALDPPPPSRCGGQLAPVDPLTATTWLRT